VLDQGLDGPSQFERQPDDLPIMDLAIIASADLTSSPSAASGSSA